MDKRGGKGLAEYTNKNFLSRDTNIDDNRYALPVAAGSWIKTETVHDPDYGWIYVNVKYLNGDASDTYRPDSSLAINRLSAYSYFDFEANKYVGKNVYSLNNYIHREYADLLIPRAVGYSAGLLDYFFRGSIEITLPLSGIYSSTDAAAGFKRITVLAQNTTPNSEEMSNGTVELIVKYKLAQSDPFQSAAVAKSDFYYIVIPAANGVSSIPRNIPAELTFDLSQSPLPVNATDVYLQVVYHGKLGNEDGAVAVGFMDISEPTPIDIFNNMDKICINNTAKSWYDAGTQLAIQQVDKNDDLIAYGTDEWDVYPHNLRLYIKFYNNSVQPDYASPTVYDYYIDNMPAGKPMRALYVLGDSKVYYSYYPVRMTTDGNDFWGHEDFLSLYTGDTVHNQDGDFPIMYTMRNFKMWPGAGFICINAPYPDDSSQCPFSAL